MSASVEPVVTLPVPAAISGAGIHGLREAIESLHGEAAPMVRVIVLRGNAEVFCRGMDLSEISAGPTQERPSISEQASADFVRVVQLLRDSSAITLAVVEGPALGGGVGLAAACDFVLATEDATFALPELLLGLVPAIILPLLSDRLGLHPAKRWAMTQATWRAIDAKNAGLVDQMVQAERLDVELRRLLRVLLRSHPRGVAVLKRLVRETRGMEISAAIAHGQSTLEELLANPKVRNELIAFRDFGCLPGEADA